MNKQELYVKGFKVGWDKAVIWLCSEYNLDLKEVQFRETTETQVEEWKHYKVKNCEINKKYKEK